MTKRQYDCELVEIISVDGQQAALILRLDEHACLGEPVPGKLTITSAIINHDVGQRTIETLNSVYKYAETQTRIDGSLEDCPPE